MVQFDTLGQPNSENTLYPRNLHELSDLKHRYCKQGFNDGVNYIYLGVLCWNGVR